MAIRISFVIPAYNIEEYIEECVNSLIRLPLKKDEYEIIIVNDGSSDGTLSVCQSLANNHSNIKIISTENNGVSNARNIGIKAALGNYICFVDGDDYHINDGIMNILSLCEDNNVDIGRGKYLIHRDVGYSKSNSNYRKFYNEVISGEQFLVNTIKNYENEVVPWLGVFKRKFLLNNKLSFDTSISYEEDQLFFLDCLFKPNCSVIQTNDYFYVYRYRSSSATKKPSMKQIEDVLNVVNQEEQLALQTKNRKIRRYARRYACSSFYQLTSIYGRIDKIERKELKHKISLKTKMRYVLNPYDFHQFIKIFLFIFFRWFVDIVYDRRNK